MSGGPLDVIFRPKRVAVVGASASPEKYGYIILKNILDAAFQGTVYPVNPKAEAILGLPCTKSIADLPEGVDLAVIIIPAKAVPEAIRECGLRSVRAAVIISGGFAESGPDGAALQVQVGAIAREFGVRIVGPNCQGVNNPHHGLCASWPLLTARGEIAVISQSGTVGAALMDWASQERLGVSAFVSLGNRADVDEADLIGHFSGDEATRAIAIYMEGAKEPTKFRRAAAATTKPIVVLKAGRTEHGRRAAESHTRSLAGRDEIYQALFRQLRIHRADTLEELYDAAKALAYLRRPTGRRILIVTSSGGSGILATDAAEAAGFTMPPPPPEVAAELRQILPPHCIVGNPLDLTGDGTAALYRQVLERAASHYDALFVIFGDPIADASQVISRDRTDLVVFLGGAEVERKERELMHLRKIPVFPTPDRGVKALARLVAFD